MNEPPYDVYNKLKEFWPRQRAKIQQVPVSSLRVANGQYKKEPQNLPIARIKKIMKIDDDVKSQMISAEAPILLAKAAELIIEELTLRAWIHTQENRRKTVQKSDIAMAVSNCEMFDFLIDIVPRDEILKSRQSNNLMDTEGEEEYAPNYENLDHSQLHQQQQPMQYFVQYAGGEDSTKLGVPNSLVQLDNGQIIHATQIGPSIPLPAGAGQAIQLVTSDQIQFLQVGGAQHPQQQHNGDDAPAKSQ